MDTENSPPARKVPANPKDLTKEEQKRLLECTANLFADSQEARDQAALSLVDFGAAGGMAVIRILGDPELSTHRKGMWALLHTLADLLSLDIPMQLEEDLVEATGNFLLVQEDNDEYVAWMAADVLANHATETPRGAVVDRVWEVFLRCLRSDHPVPQMAGIYGVGSMKHPDAVLTLLDFAGGFSHKAVEDYLESSVGRLRKDESPAVFEVPTLKVASKAPAKLN